MSRYTTHEFNYAQIMTPCPWCGSTPLISYNQGGDEWSYGCFNHKCPVQPGYYDHSPKECAIEWNRLSDTSPTQCPWCSNEAELQLQGQYYVTCPDEGCAIQPSTKGNPTPEEAWARWTARYNIQEKDTHIPVEWGEWEAGDAYKMSHTSLAREWDAMPDDWGLDLVE